MLFCLVQIGLELSGSVKALNFWSFLSRIEAQKYFHMKYQHEESLCVGFSLTTFVRYAVSPETEAFRGNMIKSSHIASQWQMQKCSLSFLILHLKPFQLNRRNQAPTSSVSGWQRQGNPVAVTWPCFPLHKPSARAWLAAAQARFRLERSSLRKLED